ncbi:MAG: hypothetical protein PWP74_1196 [Shewanella sp.]|jgi:hypothetical protein|nr:hypothetical protein [Shewanella sp.]
MSQLNIGLSEFIRRLDYRNITVFNNIAIEKLIILDYDSYSRQSSLLELSEIPSVALFGLAFN